MPERARDFRVNHRSAVHCPGCGSQVLYNACALSQDIHTAWCTRCDWKLEVEKEAAARRSATAVKANKGRAHGSPAPHYS